MTVTIKIKDSLNVELGTMLWLDILADGKRVGEATVHKYHGKDPYGDAMQEHARLGHINIDEEHRRKGYGTAAIKAMRIAFGILVAAPDNEDAQRLYERIGRCVFDARFNVGFGYGVYMLICSD